MSSGIALTGFLARHGKTPHKGYIPRNLADWREVSSEALRRSEFLGALKAAVARLPEKYREVFILRDVEHFTTAETAAVLGVEEGMCERGCCALA